MRAQLAILLLTGLLGACSDSPEEKSDREPAEEGEVVLEDVPDTGRETSGPEAGQPVQGPLRKPEDPEKQDQPQDKGSADEPSANGNTDSSETQAEQKPESSEPDSQASADARPPAEIYERYCTACHEKGMAGAPKISNTEEWQKRFDKVGMAKLVKHSVKGYRAMPAKGTCMDCSEDELRSTIEWMLDEAGVKQ